MAAADLTGAKRAMAYGLCKHINIDPSTVSNTSIEESDIASLFSRIVNSSQDEVMKWVKFSSDFAGSDGKQHALLDNLNQDLSQKSVLLGDGLKPSVADIVVFATVQAFVNTVDFGSTLQKINVAKSAFDPPSVTPPKKAEKGDTESSSKKAASGQKVADKTNASADSKKPVGEAKAPGNKETPAAKDNKTSGEKKKTQDKSAGKTSEKASEKVPEKTADKDSECNISILNIQVGLIRKAWKHPSADSSLLVEEIDLGDGNVRQVVSGLAKYCSPDDLTNRHVVLITNVKPGKLRDVMSAGLVLCASTEDHTAVEPLLPPEGAKIGERVSFAGFDGKPEDVLNPKKKQLDKITPIECELTTNFIVSFIQHLRTDENGIATFKGIPFTTSAGPCRSSIRNGNVK
nr:unnamed protein product [Digitaria exilis]